MPGSRSKIPSKNLVRLRWAEGLNSGVKGLIEQYSQGCVVCLSGLIENLREFERMW
jgi:hypothetical protein